MIVDIMLGIILITLITILLDVKLYKRKIAKKEKAIAVSIERFKSFRLNKQNDNNTLSNDTILKFCNSVNRFEQQVDKLDINIFNKAVNKFEEQVDRLGQDTPEEKEEKIPNNNTKKTIKFFHSKIEEFMKIKRETLESDEKICKRIGLGTGSLATYIGKYKEELDQLRIQCKKNHINKVRELSFNKINSKKKGK